MPKVVGVAEQGQCEHAATKAMELVLGTGANSTPPGVRFSSGVNIGGAMPLQKNKRFDNYAAGVRNHVLCIGRESSAGLASD